MVFHSSAELRLNESTSFTGMEQQAGTRNENVKALPEYTEMNSDACGLCG